jgi:azurin
MKKLLALLLVSAFAMAPAVAQEKKPETRKICVDVQGKDGKPVIDPKTKKPKQDCKEVKIHKKHEGTEVPVKK